MTDEGDTDAVVQGLVTGEAADRLLDGQPNAVEGASPVVDLVAALRAPAEAGELSGADELIARMAATAARHHADDLTPVARRRNVLVKKLTGRSAVLAAVAVLSAGTAAAAATGTLPDSIQRGFSHAFAHVGVGLPSAETEPVTTAESTTTTTEASTTTEATTITTLGETATSVAAKAVGPDATGPAKQGLCTAYLAQRPDSPSLDAVAFKNLATAAAAAGQSIQDFCHPSASTTTSTESAVAGAATTTTVHGNSGATPADTAPVPESSRGDSGSTPAATAPTAPPTSAHGRP